MYSRYWFSKADKSARTVALIGTDAIRGKTIPELSRAFPYWESMKMERFWRVDGFDSFDSAIDFDVDAHMLAN